MQGNCKAYASTLGGDAPREEKERLLQEAQRLLDERERMQKDLARAVTHPANRRPGCGRALPVRESSAS